MSITMVKYLLVGTIVLTSMVILGTVKLRNRPIIVENTKSNKAKALTLIKKLWEKQLVMTAIGIALFAIVAFYDFTGNDIFANIMTGISLVFISVASLYTVYNYNKFKEQFRKVLEELYK